MMENLKLHFDCNDTNCMAYYKDGKCLWSITDKIDIHDPKTCARIIDQMQFNDSDKRITIPANIPVDTMIEVSNDGIEWTKARFAYFGTAGGGAQRCVLSWWLPIKIGYEAALSSNTKITIPWKFARPLQNKSK